MQQFLGIFSLQYQGHEALFAHRLIVWQLLQVTFSGGQDVKAKMIGVDEDKDLAVLVVDASKLENDVGS